MLLNPRKMMMYLTVSYHTLNVFLLQLQSRASSFLQDAIVTTTNSFFNIALLSLQAMR